jgi:hypothetical protein
MAPSRLVEEMVEVGVTNLDRGKTTMEIAYEKSRPPSATRPLRHAKPRVRKNHNPSIPSHAVLVGGDVLAFAAPVVGPSNHRWWVFNLCRNETPLGSGVSDSLLLSPSTATLWQAPADATLTCRYSGFALAAA